MAPKTFSSFFRNFLNSRTLCSLSSSALLSSFSNSLILFSCSASDESIPGSTEIKYSICCSFITRSLANSRCRLANVRGESGAGGRFGSAGVPPAPPPAPGVCPASPPPCCCWPGIWAACCCGDAWEAAGAPAGTGGAVEFLVILARAGAAVGSFWGGIAGELS